MEPDSSSPIAQSDPTDAFAALRGEVSLLRRAVEGLTAERQNLPDYTPTLIEFAGRLADIEGFLSKVAESPAMRLTPENLAASIARASETARAGDRETLDAARVALRESAARIDGVVEQAWTADRQWKQLFWIGGGSLVVGALGTLTMLNFIG